MKDYDDARVLASELETLPPVPTADDDEETALRKVYALAKAAGVCPDCGSNIHASDSLTAVRVAEQAGIVLPVDATVEALVCDACDWHAVLVGEAVKA